MSDDERLRRILAAERERPGEPAERREQGRGVLRARIRPTPWHAHPALRAATAASLLGLVAGFALGRITAPTRVVERVIERTREVIRERVVVADGGAPASAPDAGAAPPVLRVRGADEHRSDAEVSLIAAAQAAMLRRSPADALRFLDGHARRFPASDLREDRDALRVRALVMAGRHAEAASAAAAFHRRYPSSPLGPRVDEDLGP